MITQLVYSYRKGFMYWGHPGGGVGPGNWGPPYNKVHKKIDPKKFWLLFYFQVALGLLFLAAAIFVFLDYQY